MKSYADARDQLIRELELSGYDQFTQDWTAELPDHHRTLPELKRFIAAIEAPERDPRERQLLVELSLDVANDLVDAEGFDDAWADLKRELEKNAALHAERVTYYACEEDSLEDAFPITPRVREILASSPA